MFRTTNVVLKYSIVGIHKIGSDGMDTPGNESEQNAAKKKINIAAFQVTDNGGIISEDGKEMYFLGIIDIATRYNINKILERFIKTKILCKERVII